MDKTRATLAIYGIQDRFDYEHPFYVHDHNLAVMQDGRIRHFLQQERITRRKRDNTIFRNLKETLKAQNQLSYDYDLVFVDNVVGRTFLESSGTVRFEAPLNEGLATGLEKGRCWWFGKEKEAWALSHELAHIFSCLPFFGNFKENSLLVHFDGGASLSNFSAAIFRNGKFEWLEYHWDLKPYSTIYNANALVFAIIGAKLADQNSVPGKFMGFAGWGTYQPGLEEWLIRYHFFNDIWGHSSTFFHRAKEDFGIELRSFDQSNPFIQNIAATLQHVFVNAIVGKLRFLQEQTGAETLYYTGGSALNIVANTKIVNSHIFKEVFIPPCPDDSGLALGATAFAEWKKHGSVEIHQPHLNNWGIDYEVEYTKETIAQVAELLLQQKLVGVCNGLGEAGPRALGNRSILALANSKKLSHKLSVEKKGREWYRPLAPVSLEKHTKYFTGEQTINPLSKFMLLDFKVLPEREKEISGALHTDRTARFQTLFSRSENPFLFDLLTFLGEKFGVKALINTSFNAAGEPIVHTVEDARKSAAKMQLDALVLNGEIETL